MKQIIKSIIIMLIAITLFTTAVYAWFSQTNVNNIKEVSSEVIRRNLNLEVQYGINGGGYTSFNEPADINAYLSSMLPGDLINIRVVVSNSNPIGDDDMELDITLFNIRAMQTAIEYNLTDFFFIENGIINLKWFESNPDYVANNYYLDDDILLDLIDVNPIEYLGYNLESYRMSNLFDYYMDGGNMVIENNINVFESTIASQHIVVIEFSIGLDPYTPDQGVGFQDGELLIDGLYSLIQE